MAEGQMVAGNVTMIREYMEQHTSMTSKSSSSSTGITISDFKLGHDEAKAKIVQVTNTKIDKQQASTPVIIDGSKASLEAVKTMFKAIKEN